MELDGVQTIYSDQVTYMIATDVANTIAPDLPLRSNQMLMFCTRNDAETILDLATEATNSQCKLEGAPGPLTVTVGSQNPPIAVPDNDPCFGEDPPNGTYLFHTADGPRPYMLVCASKGIKQNIGNTLVATWDGTSQSLVLGKNSMGQSVLMWA